MNTQAHVIISYSTARPVSKANQIVWSILVLIEILLLARMVLMVLGAPTDSVFTSALYAISSVPLYPFTFIFNSDLSVTSRFEWSTATALLAYGLLAFGFTQLHSINSPSFSRIERARALSRKKYDRSTPEVRPLSLENSMTHTVT